MECESFAAGAKLSSCEAVVTAARANAAHLLTLVSWTEGALLLNFALVHGRGNSEAGRRNG